MVTKGRCGTLLLALILLLIAGIAGAESRLRIIHSNDTHARVIPFASKEHGPQVSGAAARSALISRHRGEFPQLLLLDAGDMFQGTPFFNFFKGEAVYRLARAMGYDATTLGNHELDLDLQNLQEKLQISGMRLLCCNVFHRHNNRLVFTPYRVYKRNGKKIAVIGSIGEEAWETVDKKNRAPLYARPQTEMVREFAQKLRSRVDVIVVLSHSGFEPDQEMARQLPEADLILGGHSHTEIHHPMLIKNGSNNGLGGTIVAQAGEHGIFLGVVDLTLDDLGKIATFTGRLEKIDAELGLAADPAVNQLINHYHSQLQEKMAKIAGKSALPLDYPKDLKETSLLPMGNFTAEAMRLSGNADICLVNSGGIKGGIAAGEISYKAVFEALPYDNTVVTFLMTGQQVKQMFDYICTDPAEIDGFQYSGVSGTLNFKEKRAENIQIGGKTLEENKIYRVSTSSFVANGNLGGDKIFARVEGCEDSGIFMREAAIGLLEKSADLPDFSTNPLRLVYP